ncbi:hypothetical protein SAMN04488515_1011 [Cognatiyoonia koreensis]|uniref:Uncharacterized protein n=1 Tax=Cognatiyoonia koreensis TaxID=364200 RepID=A0A1I0P538_9RHOB|nr:hypothetical protein [Cognatiyoonia koreensis]SEW09310.1 hypothetical protein SAMN04488515_1011 [Cognatiyoonia koreensis]
MLEFNTATNDDQVMEGKIVPLTLVIGDLRDWEAAGRIIPSIEGFMFADVSDIDTCFIRKHNPTVILSTLVTREFDAVEIARKLGQMVYTGSYRVLTNNIPNVELIREEVSQIAPQLDFDIVDLSKIFPDL